MHPVLYMSVLCMQDDSVLDDTTDLSAEDIERAVDTEPYVANMYIHC